MSSHGSRQYKNAWIQYRDQDLKLIRLMWQELAKKEFSYDRKTHLDDLVALEIGHHAFGESRKILGRIIFNEIYYSNLAGCSRLLPKNHKHALAIFALAYHDNKYELIDGSMYIPHAPRNLSK